MPHSTVAVIITLILDALEVKIDLLHWIQTPLRFIDRHLLSDQVLVLLY